MDSTRELRATQLRNVGAPRLGGGPITTALNLGPLASLPGSWKGSGFSVMWRPDNNIPPGNDPSGIKRFLQLNLTSETLEFHVIPGAVPNRGLATQPDIFLYGLHYLQRVTDADAPAFPNAGEALHIEPGLFMNVPASGNLPTELDTSVPATIVRLASIPHGVSLLMQGANPGATPVPGRPDIPPIYPIASLPTFTPEGPPTGFAPYGLGIQPVDIPPTPPPPPPAPDLEHIVPEVELSNDGVGSQSNGPYVPPYVLDPAFFQAAVDDPNAVLRDAIAAQEILGTITISLSTEAVQDSIGNIPFLGNPADPDNLNTSNAFVKSATATFWIEWVRVPGGHHHHHHERLWDRHDGNRDDLAHAIEPYLGEPTFLQLQYSQTAILIFNGVLWPHVTVATLTLSAG
jgi:hypothetical protein